MSNPVIDAANRVRNYLSNLGRRSPSLSTPKKEREILVLTTRPKDKQSGDLFAHLEERVTKTVPLHKLKKLYDLDGLTFRIVNDYIDAMIGPGFILDGDKETVDELLHWAKTIKLKHFMREIVRDSFLCANAWIELGYNDDGSDIIKLQIINPNFMDYIRDGKDQFVELDENGDPVGFKKSRGTEFQEVIWTKDKITVDKKTMKTFPVDQDGRNRIAHFKLWSLGESFLGTTPLQSIYSSAIIRLNISRNTGEVAFRSEGLVIHVGDEEIQPTNEQLDNISSAFEDITEQTIFVFKTRPKIMIDRIPTPEIEGRERLMYYYADLECTGLGKSLALVMEPVQRGRAGDIDIKDMEFEYRVKSLQEVLAEQILEKIFYRYMDAKGMARENITDMRFKTHMSSIMLSKSRRIATLARRSLIKYDPELEKHLRELEDLPVSFLDEAIEKWEETGAIPEQKPEKEIDVRERVNKLELELEDLREKLDEQERSKE